MRPVLFLTVFLGLETGQAQYGSIFDYGTTRIGGSIWFPNGESRKGFAMNSSGFLGSLELKRSNAWFSLIGGIRLANATGREVFLDGSTTTEEAFTFYGIEAELGLLFHLIPSKEFSFQPYIGAVGVGGIGYLKLPSKTYNSLNATESRLTTGYELIGGVELAPGRKANTISYTIFGEGRLRLVRGNFAGKSDFQLDGFLLMGGIGF